MCSHDPLPPSPLYPFRPVRVGAVIALALVAWAALRWAARRRRARSGAHKKVTEGGASGRSASPVVTFVRITRARTLMYFVAAASCFLTCLFSCISPFVCCAMFVARRQSEGRDRCYDHEA